LLLLSLAFAQAISSAPPETIDLTIPRSCEPGRTSPDEVIVCARREGPAPYRLDVPSTEQFHVPGAALQIGERTTLAAETEQVDVGGFSSNRLMLRLKIKF
jgi:hypothetical protein